MFKRKTTALATTAIAAVLAIVAAGPSDGSSTVPITTCGQTVTTDAVLTKNLTCAGDNGINVGAAGITIDLKGFTLHGDNSPGHSGIDDTGGYDGLTVKNGIVRNFAVGMFAFNNANQVSVFNLAASGNVGSGMYIGGASASVKSSSASGNGQYGIQINGGSAKIQSLTASGNGINGIYVVGASAFLKSANASGNGNNGIVVVGGSGSVSSSTASGNAFYGIFVNGASASVTSSTASGNATNGIYVNGASASVKSSTASGNGHIGIAVQSDGAAISGNRAETNGFTGGASDLNGLGIDVIGSPAPVGANVARGNDDPTECVPASLC